MHVQFKHCLAYISTTAYLFPSFFIAILTSLFNFNVFIDYFSLFLTLQWINNYSKCYCTSVIGQVSEVMLMCGPAGVINQCNANWNVSPYMYTYICTYVGMYSYAYFGENTKIVV